MEYEKVDAEEEAELTESLRVRQAPTLVIIHGDQVETYAGPSGIKAYLDHK